MSTFLGRFGIGLVVFFLVASVFWWRTMLWTGQLRAVHPHFDGQCRQVAPIAGAEDLVIDHQNRLVFVSSLDRRNLATSGAIWSLPVDQPTLAKPLAVKGMGGAVLAPHGIDLFVAGDGTRYLFVIDHGSTPRHLVRKFAYVDGNLILARTYDNAAFYSPNSVVALGPDQFYLTNDKREKAGSLSAFLAAVFRKKSGNVVWVDGDLATSVTDRIAYANGIAAAADGSQLYVASTIDQSLRVFDRDQSTGALVLADRVHLASGLDNIKVAEDGSLWIGSHPRLFDFSAHAKDSTKRSPSQVFHLDLKSKEINEAYLSDGSDLSALSVAAKIDQTLFMGGVFDANLLACQMNQEQTP